MHAGAQGYLLKDMEPDDVVDAVQRAELLTYLRAGGAWTGSDTQLNTKASGLSRLMIGSGEYQFI